MTTAKTAKEVNILVCSHCGKAFVTEDDNEKYCTKRDCKHISAAKKFIEKFKKDM